MVMERLKIDIPSEGPFREQNQKLYRRIVDFTLLTLDGTTYLDESDVDEEFREIIANRIFKAIWNEPY